MTPTERAAAAAAKMKEAIGEMVAAITEWLVDFGEFIGALGFDCITAYAAAKEEHPEWVHRANHHKKKRIRKKYHDKIMRQYGRSKNATD